MALPIEQTRRIQVIEHPVLHEFNEEFGTKSDLSRYESIRSSERIASPEVPYLNELQMDSYIPSGVALLLKNNLHDTAFITHTTRSILYKLKHTGKIGEDCFNFLHQTLNRGDFLSVYRYLYVVNLYSKIAQNHDADVLYPAFRFESPAHYSDKLIKTPSHHVDKEEKTLERQSREQFMKKWLTELASRPTCPREAQQQIFALVNIVGSSNAAQFRTGFLNLLERLKNSPELEKICWEEFQSSLTSFRDQDFFAQAYLRLKTESYYKNCLSRVTTLRQSLERTNSQDLLELSEKCKKAYNGCTYLLGDHKNMAACSAMRFAALVGNMRSEWQWIDHAFNRARQMFSHHLCSCQAQAPASQNELAEWPFNFPSLIPLNTPQPPTAAHLQTCGITQANFEENSKKTIAVIGCKWGGGHMEVSRGVCNNLSSLGYHPISVDLPEVLMSEDPIRNSFITRWLGKDWSTAILFETLLKDKAFALINFLRWINAKLFGEKGYSDTQLKLVMEHLLKIKPDSVITTYSAHNEVLIKACEMLGIPCIHIATDIDNEIQTRDHPPSFNLFKMALPFNTLETINPVIKTTTESQRIFTGPPVKHEYTIPRSEEEILRLKQEWGIDINKKVVIISNGKAGAFSPYPEILARKYANTRPEDIPIHLVVICGKDNLSFKQYLEQHVCSKTNLPMKIELHTPKMEQLMAMASHGGVLIGKGGGTTIFECLARGTRVLVDNARPHHSLFQSFRHFIVICAETLLRMIGFKPQLPWEKANTQFAKKYGLADVFENEKEFLSKLGQLLNNDNRPVRLNFELKNIEVELPRQLRELLVRAQFDPSAHRAREIRQGL